VLAKWPESLSFERDKLPIRKQAPRKRRFGNEVMLLVLVGLFFSVYKRIS